jgi:hypothetical protein
MKIYKEKMWAFLKETNQKRVDLIVSFNGID